MRNRGKKMLWMAGLFAVMLCGVSACKKDGKQENPESGKLSPGHVEESENQKNPEQDTGTQDGYKEAPTLHALAESGRLPEVQNRLPAEAFIYRADVGLTGVYGEDVQFAVENADKITGQLISEGLFAYSDNGTIVPNVAKAYTVNQDFTQYTIELRQGMRWSDGVPFTADDCVFFYEKMCLTEVFGEPLWDCFKVEDGQGKVQKATFRKVDTYCFEVTFPEANPDFLSGLLQQGGICFAPEHYYVNLLPEYMGADAAKAKATDMGYASVEEMLRETVTKAWNVQGVPTLNPYTISEEEGKDDVTGNYYEFVRNPYYWKVDGAGQQLPYLERLGFTRISGESQKMLLTTEGFLSVAELTGAQIAEAKEGAERGEYRVITWAGTLAYAVKNNLKNFPEKCPYEEAVRGIGAAHPEYWYLE